MQQEELGTTIEYSAIHDMKQHDKLGATVMENSGKGVILNTQVEIENLFKALVLPEINYPLPVFGASMTDLNSIQCLLRQCFKRHFILEPVDIQSIIS